MRAITAKEFGTPEVLKISETHKPTPNAEQLPVSVHAFALNRADLLQRRVKYPPSIGITKAAFYNGSLISSFNYGLIQTGNNIQQLIMGGLVGFA